LKIMALIRSRKQISMDLSPSFIAGAAESFPAAQIAFDRFHVVKLLNLKKSVELNPAENIQHKLDRPTGGMICL